MKPTEVARYLRRAALDREFRALAKADPDASFEGYALSGTEKEILRRGDQEMLRLLADAVRDAVDTEETRTGERPVAEAPPPVTTHVLPPVDLLLQLVAVPSRDGAGTLRLTHVASLHAAPAPGTSLPPPPAEAPEGATAPVHFRIRIAPHAASLPDGRMAVTYAPSIVAEGAEETGSGGATGTATATPWGHRVESEAARSAADAVKKAAPAERYERLLDLIAALKGEGEGGS